MKKGLLIGLAIVLIGGMIFTGCAKPAPTTPITTTAPTTAAPPTVLSFALQSAPVGWGAKAVIEWTQGIQKATNGRVKFEIYWAQSLVKVPDTWIALKSGVAKTALVVPGSLPGLTPVNDVISLPL